MRPAGGAQRRRKAKRRTPAAGSEREAMFVLFGRDCTYWIPVPRSLVAGLKACPECGCRLENISRAEWTARHLEAGRTNPGHAGMIGWLREKCLPVNVARRLYDEAMGNPHDYRTDEAPTVEVER